MRIQILILGFKGLSNKGGSFHGGRKILRTLKKLESKGGFQQKQKCNLGPSALFTGVDNYVLEELSQ